MISSAGKKQEGQKDGEKEEAAEEEEEEDEGDAEAALLREQHHIAPNLENCKLKPYQLKGAKTTLEPPNRRLRTLPVACKT